MTFRQAVALALVGWYLMIPPPRFASSWLCSGAIRLNSDFLADKYKCFTPEMLAPDLNAPLSRWHDQLSYEKLSDCSDAVAALQQAYKLDEPEHSAKCIASDDPRLAK